MGEKFKVSKARREHIKHIREQLIARHVPTIVADYVVNKLRGKCRVIRGIASFEGEAITLRESSIVSYDMLICEIDGITRVYWYPDTGNSELSRLLGGS